VWVFDRDLSEVFVVGGVLVGCLFGFSALIDAMANYSRSSGVRVVLVKKDVAGENSKK
jgi:hypothetical protein